MKLKQAVRRQLRRHPRAASLVADRLRAIGGERLTQRLERAADVATMTPPFLDARPLRLLLCDGADQIAQEAVDKGWDSFERPFPTVFSALVRADQGRGVVVDVGANTGFYALLATAVEPAVRVVAFEPYPPVAAVFQENVKLNRQSTRIEVVSLAVGRAVGVATLFIPNNAHGLVETSCSLNSEFTYWGVGDSLQVDVTTLDNFFRGRLIRPSLIKIDVESMEHHVLAGATDVLNTDRPIVIVEVLPSADPAELEHLRLQHRYVDVRLHPDAAIVAKRVEADAECWNHLWAPEERLEEVVRLLSSCDLVVMR